LGKIDHLIYKNNHHQLPVFIEVSNPKGGDELIVHKTSMVSFPPKSITDLSGIYFFHWDYHCNR
jgi:hypothetical protein